ncbi:hypothetical protein [Aquabacterium lacunae]|nr:hypothetical protein [Aquabacterium lacunae]
MHTPLRSRSLRWHRWVALMLAALVGASEAWALARARWARG